MIQRLLLATLAVGTWASSGVDKKAFPATASPVVTAATARTSPGIGEVLRFQP